jgi:acetylornithine deacetylase/succinyl-diaminopimelate desuccinylase-like protein
VQSLATQAKTTLSSASRSLFESRRIAQLAEETELFQAQRWFARERAWINDIHLQLCRIPAPTFFEQARAEWFVRELSGLGWRASLDRAGNVLATFGEDNSGPLTVVSAHLDTVLTPGRPEDIHYLPDGRLIGPGTADNGSGLSALLALARVFAENSDLHPIASSILLVANVGEEGEGNLSGMRYLCRHHPQANQFRAFVVLDGPSSEHVTAQALASRRFEISFNGPGGHSWNDYGTPNPVHAVSEVINSFLRDANARLVDRRVRCSFNFGIVEGGSSVNSIPSSARTKLDLRSEEPPLLDEVSILLTACVERALENGNRTARNARLTAKVRELGSRPGGRLPDDSVLLKIIYAVDHYLSIRSRLDCASTDANVPLSMGLPAVSLGTGGQGGGAHTTQEWYSPEGREQGLRRILLILAALCLPIFGSPAPADQA